MEGEETSKPSNQWTVLILIGIVTFGFIGTAAATVPPISSDTTIQLSDSATAVLTSNGSVSNKKAIQSTCGINSVNFRGPGVSASPTDQDDDGYVSRFVIEMHFDTQCFGEYDNGGPLGDPSIEPALELYINDALVARILNFKEFTASGDEIGADVVVALEPEEEFYDKVARGRLDIRVEFFDNDPPTESIVPADKIDEWSGSLLWEPPSEDIPTTTTTITTSVTETTTTATPTTPQQDTRELSIAQVGKGVVKHGDEITEAIAFNTSESFQAGTQVRLTAEPREGYVFDHWEGSINPCHQYNQTITVSMDSDTEVVAHFVEEGEQVDQQGTIQANATTGQNRTVTVVVTAVHPEKGALAGSTLNLTGIPNSWAVVNASATNDGSWFPNDRKWFWRTVDEQCIKGSVTFQRPANASMMNQTLGATISSADGMTAQTNVTVSLGNPFRVALTDISPSTTVSPDRTVRMTYTVTNQRETPMDQVSLQLASLPDSITVVNQSADTASWSPSAKMWLWPSLDTNETVTATVTLQINSSIDDGVYEIVAKAISADGTTITQTTKLNVTNTSLNSEALSIEERMSVSRAG